MSSNIARVLGDYDVGYCKPPVKSRFTQCGNRKGRPKGSRNKPKRNKKMDAINMILAEGARLMKIQDAGKELTLPTATVIFRSVAIAAAKGHARQQKLFFEIWRPAEAERKRQVQENFEFWVEYKFEALAKLEYQKRHGIVGDEPLPHPKDIIINAKDGTVEIIGPITSEEKIRCDQARAYRARARELIPTFEALLENEEDPEARKELKDSIALQKKLIANVSAQLSD